ncbi:MULTISPECIES: hypothetical protein [unclassified Streptomyces]|uniref:hypothetical protein n=1 Tax=unclassified Streptomyces TaxID=2593676 RepID=UPI0003628E5C|nr:MULTISPECIES: hypothetical protein [unclassified Streptomyces]MYQ80292.1 hypothetical protein [Streptomyces sp. SID4923]
MLDLYARTWQGKAPGEDEYVISADEKTSIQARCRCHPTLAPGQAHAMRVNHTYGRGGALAYLAAYDVHQVRVFGVVLAGLAVAGGAVVLAGRRQGDDG